jgi:hypothetical protein
MLLRASIRGHKRSKHEEYKRIKKDNGKKKISGSSPKIEDINEIQENLNSIKRILKIFNCKTYTSGKSDKNLP